MFTKEDFLSGKLDSIIGYSGDQGYSSSEQFQSVKVGNPDIYRLIRKSNSDVKEAVRIWNANVGDSGWKVECNRFNQESRNVAISQAVTDQLDDLKFKKLKNKIVTQLATFGRSVITVNRKNKLVAHPHYYYEIFWDSYNQEATSVRLKKDGAATGKNLVDDVFIITIPDQEGEREPDTPIDAAYRQILSDMHIWKSNHKKWSGGLIDPLFFMLDWEMGDGKVSQAYWQTKVQTKDGKPTNKLDSFLKRVKNLLNKGSNDPNAVFASPNVKDIKHITRTVKEMLGDEFETKARRRIATAFGLNPADLGVEQAKYDNAQTYNYVLGDKIGRPIEDSITELVTDFIFPKILRIRKEDKIVFSYNQPTDPQKEEKKKTFISAYQVSYASGSPAFHPNEMREVFGKHELSDLELEKLRGTPIVNASVNNEPGANQTQTNSKKKFSVSSTPTTRALKSKDYRRIEVDENGNQKVKGFLPNWGKAFEKQLNEFLKNIKKKKTVEDISKKDLPKIESFYSFNTLKRDLMKFANKGYNEFIKETKKQPNAFKLPDLIVKAIDLRVEALLKGNELFKSVDEETSNQILNIIKEAESVSEAVSFITDTFSSFTKARAKLIAETEVADAVENSRFLMYKDEGYKWKKWLTVADEDVRATHQDNEDEGIIAINKKFSNGNDRAGQEPRCRCTTIYGKTKEELE